MNILLSFRIKLPHPRNFMKERVVESANLRLFKSGRQSNRTEASEFSRKEIRVDVYQLFRDPDDEEMISKLVDSKMVRVSELEWQHFDVTSTVQEWVDDPTTNNGLVISSPSRDLSSILHDITGKEIEPVLEITTYRRNIVGRVKRRLIKDESCHKSTPDKCCRRPVFVNFTIIGWNDWVISPPGFYGAYCIGKCPYGYKPANTFARMQTLLHKLFPTNYPGGCCKPIETYPIPIIYHGAQGKEIIEMKEDKKTTNLRAKLRTSRTSLHVYFDIRIKHPPIASMASTVLLAELKIFSVKHYKEKIKVEVFQLIIDPNTGKTTQKLVDSKMTDFRPGWETFNIEQPVQTWIDDLNTNTGLVISSPSVNINEILPVKKDEAEAPTLQLTVREMEILGRPKRKSTVDSVNCDEQVGGLKRCCMNVTYVDFQEINWLPWIVAPAGYNAVFCVGACPPLYRMRDNFEMLKEEMRRKVPGSFPDPCCSPTVVYPLPLLFYDTYYEFSLIMKSDSKTFSLDAIIRSSGTDLHLYFDTWPVSSSNAEKELIVSSARLKLFRADSYHKQEKIRIDLQLLDVEPNTKKTTRKVIDSKVTDFGEGWVTFDLTQMVQIWIDDPNRNLGLVLSSHSVNINDVVTSGSNKGKLPNLYFATDERYIIGREKRQQQHRSNDACTLQMSSDKQCCTNETYVDFRDINWDNWVLAPRGYKAVFCIGSCARAYRIYDNFAVIKYYLRAIGRGIPPACCNPTIMYPMPIMYYTQSKEFAIMFKKNLLVAECKCF